MKPIILRAHEVRRLHAAGEVLVVRKAKDQPPVGHVFAGWCVSSTNKADEGAAVWTAGTGALARDPHHTRCPLGKPTERRWVRETWAYGVHAMASARDEEGPFVYAATNHGEQGRLCDRWRSPVVMPRSASRFVVEIADVQAKQVQTITEAEAIAAGFELVCMRPTGDDSGSAIHGPHGMRAEFGPDLWDANPWVWLARARRVEA